MRLLLLLQASRKMIVVYDKDVDNEVFWLNQLQSRTTPWQSAFIINMACFFLAVSNASLSVDLFNFQPYKYFMFCKMI